MACSKQAPKHDLTADASLAERLGVSRAAIALLRASEVFDLHIDSFIWTRLLGYDVHTRHDSGPLSARWLGQADLPRLRLAGVGAATWSITTNPWRATRSRLRALLTNYRKLLALLSDPDSTACVVTNYREYLAARSAGRHAAFLGIQGGNALSDPKSLNVFPVEQLLRVTLVHLTNSDLGTTSSPLRLGHDRGLLPRGRELVRELESRGTFVDLAHSSERLFWDVVAEHDKSRPLIVSHTGLAAVHRHWRNLDDRQLRAIADSGGVVGVLYHGPFLGDPPWGGKVRTIARHLAHGIKVIGARHMALGSDWDGLIATPLDMPSCAEFPRLVQALLDEQVQEEDIVSVLGKSALALIAATRP